ncbi:MAG TPA: hypothetical protein VJ826_00845 [Candidatus Polarisedimenticolaceae bacterium]|nr:hypothetical protein [Candidatus Polarisedimenticolaceae bacterium]
MLIATAAVLLLATAPSSAPTLSRLARVAELYRDSALNFACLETIEYRGGDSGRIQFSYIFIHDDDKKFRDYRTWRTGTTASAKGEEVDPANYHVPRFLQSAYLWAFVFRKDRQPHHAFFNLGKDEALGRPAVKIGFQPKGSLMKGWNDWAGVAWIDAETSQILKVEAWSPEHWNRKVKLDADVAAAPAKEQLWESEPYEIETVVTEFSVLKNGMRFPGKITIDRVVSTVLGGEREWRTRDRAVYHVTQEYSKYEFFSVRTEVEIRRIVDAD